MPKIPRCARDAMERENESWLIEMLACWEWRRCPKGAVTCQPGASPATPATPWVKDPNHDSPRETGTLANRPGWPEFRFLRAKEARVLVSQGDAGNAGNALGYHVRRLQRNRAAFGAGLLPERRGVPSYPRAMPAMPAMPWAIMSDAFSVIRPRSARGSCLPRDAGHRSRPGRANECRLCAYAGGRLNRPATA
jgi:hypothetical protein